MTWRMALNMRSGNAKTGPIPTWESSFDTCSEACENRATGRCYAMHHHSARHWFRLSLGLRGMTFAEFLAKLEALPAKSIPVARAYQWGDLPGDGDAIDVPAFRALVVRVVRAIGTCIAFTHKPLTLRNVRELLYAYRAGWSVNVSCDSLADLDTKADRLTELGAGELRLAVVLPHDHKQKVCHSPGGRRVVTCPAVYSDVSCGGGKGQRACGNGRPLCGRLSGDRDYAVGFPAHGPKRRLTVVQGGA